jgi:hypothetical protein
LGVSAQVLPKDKPACYDSAQLLQFLVMMRGSLTIAVLPMSQSECQVSSNQHEAAGKRWTK